MKDLLNLFNQQRQTLDFDGIKIGLASPDLIRSWSFALTVALEKNVQRVTSLVGCGHDPTSVEVVTLRTVPLCHSAVPVPAGSVTVIELPASPDSPPVADTRKSAT